MREESKGPFGDISAPLLGKLMRFITLSFSLQGRPFGIIGLSSSSVGGSPDCSTRNCQSHQQTKNEENAMSSIREKIDGMTEPCSRNSTSP